MKTELSHDFEYRDELAVKHEHDVLVLMAIVFSLPIIGIALLILVIIVEAIIHLIRYSRLVILTAKHYLWKQIKSLI